MRREKRQDLHLIIEGFDLYSFNYQNYTRIVKHMVTFRQEI